MNLINLKQGVWTIISLFILTIFNSFVLAQESGDVNPCTNKALDLLKKYDQNGYAIVTKVNDLSFFSVWLDCGSPPLYGVSGGVHETNHRLSSNLSDYAGRIYGYFLGGEVIKKVQMKDLFYRSEIAEYLDNQDKQYGYYETYLTGASGEQDFLVLLDELNAYTHGLKNSLQLVNYLKGMAVSDRDGVAAFMYYTELYLRKARLSHPEQWEQIYSDTEYLDLINSLWKRAESILKAALKYQQLGMYDKFVIKKVYEPKNISELKQTFSKGGQQFNYDTQILTLANSLKQSPPQASKNNKVQNKTLQQKSVHTTISIDGKQMGLEELEAYLEENPELKDMPQIQEILKKMRAEKGK